MRRAGVAAAVAALVMALAGCGGGSTPVATTPTPVNNTLPLVVDLGPNLNGQTVGADNSLYTNVSICNPGTATCQTIDHVLVDTGSSGLRILSSALGLAVPYVTDANKNGLGNCIQYPDTSFQWGPMALVDVHLAGGSGFEHTDSDHSRRRISAVRRRLAARAGWRRTRYRAWARTGFWVWGFSGRIAVRRAHRPRLPTCTSVVRQRDALRPPWR